MIAAVQMGTLEFHIWGSKYESIERPDRLVFDLDPSEEIDFSEIKQAAFEVKEKLEKYGGLKSVPMLTGGKGIHVIAPMVIRRWLYYVDFRSLVLIGHKFMTFLEI